MVIRSRIGGGPGGGGGSSNDETVLEPSLTEETQSMIAERVAGSQNGGSNGGDA